MSSTLLAAFVSGILLALPFLLPLLFPLAWASLIPLLWAIDRTGRLRQAFFYGWLTGTCANLVGFYWIPYTIRVFGGFSYGVSALAFLIYAAYGGLAFAVFSLLLRRFGFGPLNIFPAVFWVAIEFWFPQLFPWHLANSQSSFITLIQSADLVGPYGTSFLIVWGNTLLAGLLPGVNARISRRRLAAATFGIVLAAVLLYGHFRCQR